MRYEAAEAAAGSELPVYSHSSSLHYMLNFTVFLALVIGVALLFLGRHGRVMWLQIWSVGLVFFSTAYLGAAMLGII